MICCIFGHRQLENLALIKEKLFELIEFLIVEKGVEIFLFGGFGEFDELAYNVVSELKLKYKNIKRVFCLWDERQLKESKRKKWINYENYEDIVYYTPKLEWWYKRIYYRNCEMIDRSDYAIFYAKENPDSGAYKALKYAKTKMNTQNIYNLV